MGIETERAVAALAGEPRCPNCGASAVLCADLTRLAFGLRYLNRAESFSTVILCFKRMGDTAPVKGRYSVNDCCDWRRKRGQYRIRLPKAFTDEAGD